MDNRVIPTYIPIGYKLYLGYTYLTNSNVEYMVKYKYTLFSWTLFFLQQTACYENASHGRI